MQVCSTDSAISSSTSNPSSPFVPDDPLILGLASLPQCSLHSPSSSPSTFSDAANCSGINFHSQNQINQPCFGTIGTIETSRPSISSSFTSLSFDNCGFISRYESNTATVATVIPTSSCINCTSANSTLTVNCSEKKSSLTGKTESSLAKSNDRHISFDPTTELNTTLQLSSTSTETPKVLSSGTFSSAPSSSSSSFSSSSSSSSTSSSSYFSWSSTNSKQLQQSKLFTLIKTTLNRWFDSTRSGKSTGATRGTLVASRLSRRGIANFRQIAQAAVSVMAEEADEDAEVMSQEESEASQITTAATESIESKQKEVIDKLYESTTHIFTDEDANCPSRYSLASNQETRAVFQSGEQGFDLPVWSNSGFKEMEKSSSRPCLLKAGESDGHFDPFGADKDRKRINTTDTLSSMNHIYE